jgi:hypothetical protein
MHHIAPVEVEGLGGLEPAQPKEELRKVGQEEVMPHGVGWQAWAKEELVLVMNVPCHMLPRMTVGGQDSVPRRRLIPLRVMLMSTSSVKAKQLVLGAVGTAGGTKRQGPGIDSTQSRAKGMGTGIPVYIILLLNVLCRTTNPHIRHTSFPFFIALTSISATELTYSWKA